MTRFGDGLPSGRSALYFDRYLWSRENYGQKWNHVEQNALRAGLIKEGEEWPYRGSIFDLMW